MKNSAKLLPSNEDDWTNNVGCTLTLDPDSMTRSVITKSLLGSFHHRRMLTKPSHVLDEVLKMDRQDFTHEISQAIKENCSHFQMWSVVIIFNDLVSIIICHLYVSQQQQCQPLAVFRALRPWSIQQQAGLPTLCTLQELMWLFVCPGWQTSVLWLATNVKSFKPFKINGSCMKGFWWVHWSTSKKDNKMSHGI